MTEHDDLFRFWLTQGWRYRRRQSVEMQRNPRSYKDRMQMEYNIIRDIPGYTDYFLMVSDIVRFAKDSGVVVGPGRGSGASSLVCWLLRITEIDPLLFPMLFERFISVDRIDLPDIDIDFEDERRWEVIDYAQRKYGYDRVANILNFVRYKGRNSLDDIARVYNIPGWRTEAIKSKLVDRAEGHPRFANTLEDTIATNLDVQQHLSENPEIQLATKLEGNYRNSSIHPAGIVISSVPLDQVCATYEKQSGEEHGSGIAYDKRDAEYLGFLKLDFLSLTTLSGIRATLEAIGRNINWLYQASLHDAEVYQAFCDGNVLGIFQFEGHTTRRVLKQVQPRKFMDLSDINALSRPGADDKAYIHNKNDGVPEAIHPIVAEILKGTYGTIVYQEQILLLLRDLGNFPSLDTNKIRKAISAKMDTTVFNVYREQFIEGCETHGVSSASALDVWDQIIKSSEYAFNISHSVSYSLIAYWQMYLKVHHNEFYLGQLLKCPDTEIGRARRGKLILEAMKERHIGVNVPDLVMSEVNWCLKQGELYAGFTAIKGIGTKVAASIVDWRKQKKWEGCGRELKWGDLLEVPGIGPGRIATIRDFCDGDDPFDLGRVHRWLEQIRRSIANHEFPGIPFPGHTSVMLHTDWEEVVFAGVVTGKRYYDVVDKALSYGMKEYDDLRPDLPRPTTEAEVLERLKDPQYREYLQLFAVDEHGPRVRIRISRKKYPQFKNIGRQIKPDKHVIVAVGTTRNYWDSKPDEGLDDVGGSMEPAVQVKELYVFVPD